MLTLSDLKVELFLLLNKPSVKYGEVRDVFLRYLADKSFYKNLSPDESEQFDKVMFSVIKMFQEAIDEKGGK